MQRVGFGAVLRRYRVAAGLTQEGLAERAALSPRGISDLERSVRTQPYPATVHRLAEALGLSESERRVLQTAAKSRPLSSDDGAASTLPSPISSFVGREHKIAEVRRLLSATRLVTLLGTGGIGKTRLAVEVASGMVDQFDDGVAFVSLASVRNSELVVGAIAETLGTQEMGSRGLTERLHAHLRNRHLLLVLDNFEHVLRASDAVAGLLAQCPRLSVLVTSRAPLRIRGEREVAVHQLHPDEAARLFIERAASVHPDVALADEGVVAEICARLDGLPLAIELAAARLRALPPEMLLERLEYRLPLLVGGARDLPARQQTLSATIGWSYDLLDAREQRLFRRLSAFVGGFTLEAAEAVCDDDAHGAAVLDGVESLLAKCLLERDDGLPRAPRFRMLETVREFAVEQARSAGELDAIRRVHAAYFRDIAEFAASKFSSVDAHEWLRRLEADHNNVRAALSWTLEQGDAVTALRLGSAIWHFWYARGHLTEGSRWLEEALRLGDGIANRPEMTALRAKALTGAGVLAHYQGHYARAGTLCAQSLALCRTSGDQSGIAAALHGLAMVARTVGDFASARTMYQEARSIHEALDDRWGLSYTLRYLAVVLWMEADYAAARPAVEASLALASDIGDKQGMAVTLLVRSYIARSLGENEAAEDAANECFALHEAYGNRRGAAQGLWALGMAVAGQGRYGEAGEHYTRALSTFAEIGDRYFACACLITLAQVAIAAHRAYDAVRLLAAGSGLMASIGAALWPSLQTYFDRSMLAARGTVGEAAFASAWAEGRSMSMDHAVMLGAAVC